MHADDLDIDVPLVRRLLAAQFPQWAGLPLERVASDGTDNAIYRLGDDMAVRLPRAPGVAARVEKEHLWLPRLAPHLPVAIPVPLAKGSPIEGYPCPWSVFPWLEGEHPTSELSQVATDLAEFIVAFHQIDPAGGPAPGEHNFGRGVPLDARDGATRAAMGSLGDTLDLDAVTALWEEALHVPAWRGPPVWIHGDLAAGNILVDRGRLRAVIDFGGLAVGDPACDLMVAWSLLPAGTREAFRAALGLDDATWVRGRGWALSVALIYIPYYERTKPVGVARARHTIDMVLAASESA